MMLDAVVNYLPSPLDIPPVKGMNPDNEGRRMTRKADDNEPFAALRVQDHQRPARQPHVLPRLLGQGRERHDGHATRRATSASASAASCACTPTSAKSSARPTPATSTRPSACSDTRTGDTLCDEKHPILLEKMIFPEPVISIAIEPKTKVDVEKLGVGLQKLAAEDPSLPHPHRRGVGPDDHQRHGRAPPRDHRRPPEARVQGRVERRQARGRVPRGHHARRRSASTSTPSSPAAAASTVTSLMEIEPRRARRRLRLRERHRRRRHPEGVHPGHREGRHARRWTAASSPATRSSTCSAA